MKAKFLLASVAFVALFVIGVALANRPTAFAGTAAQTQTTAAGNAMQQPAQGYTMADVAAHNHASSCWSAINGKVYDLTHWINQHPGGPSPILSLCGTDGSAAFNAQHGGQRRPANELSGFYIGPLN